jgi:hypothetical protein
MDLDRFNYRGLGIGFFGVGLTMGGVADRRDDPALRSGRQ